MKKEYSEEDFARAFLQMSENFDMLYSEFMSVKAEYYMNRTTKIEKVGLWLSGAMTAVFVMIILIG